MLPSFDVAFQHHARLARRRLLARALLNGLSLASLALGCGLAAPWLLLHAGITLSFDQGVQWIGVSLLGLLGLVPLLLDWARRPDDARLALFFDARLSSKQAISAALEVEGGSPPQRFAARLLHTAAELLERAPPPRLRPQLLSRVQVLLPVGCAVVAVFGSLPAPPLPETDHSAGASRLDAEELRNFEALFALEHAPALTGPDEHSLIGLAARARRLERELAEGVSTRRALSDIAKLQDTVTQRLEAFPNASQDRGVQAAVAALREVPRASAAAQALEAGDLEGFDEEMRRLSSAEERAARRAARAALETAANTSRADGSGFAQRLLSEQLALFDARELAAEQIRKSLRLTKPTPHDELTPSAVESTDARKAPAETTRNKGSPAVNLTPAERLRAAQRLQAGLERGNVDFEAELGRLRATASIEELERAHPGLADALERHGKPSPLAERQQALQNADRALARLQNALSERPLPLPSASPSVGRSSAPPLAPREGEAAAGSGAGPGSHDGQSDAVDAAGVYTKTDQAFDLSQGGFTSSKGRSSTGHRMGARAVIRAELQAVAPAQIESVERAEIPAEYREQVSRYFSGD